MKKFVAILSAVMIAILALVPMASASAASGTMYISASNGGEVNVRTLPDKSSKALTRLGVGFPVTVEETGMEWCKVSAHVLGKTITGYVASQFLSSTDPTTRTQNFKTVSKPYTVTVRPTNANGYVNLRPTAVKSGVIRTMYKGEKLTVVAESNAWYKVNDAYGNTGYVVKAYAKK